MAIHYDKTSVSSKTASPGFSTENSISKTLDKCKLKINMRHIGKNILYILYEDCNS